MVRLKKIKSEHLSTCRRISKFRQLIGNDFKKNTTTTFTGKGHKSKVKNNCVTITLEKQVLNIIIYKDIWIVFFELENIFYLLKRCQKSCKNLSSCVVCF